MLVSCHHKTGHALINYRKLCWSLKGHLLSRLISQHVHDNAHQSDRVIFSGIQPTGIPHLGNYLGALQQWVKLQDTASSGTKLFFSIVDLHAVTIPQEPQRLKKWKKETLAMLLAVGLNPERSTLFYQSSVPAHAELMWILSCTASIGYLSRMTQWKSKLQLAPDTSPLNVSSKSRLKLGLFSYPVLQAADILVHRATHVPVGEDQNQHLEFARECAKNFNSTYGGHLKSPATITSCAKRVMSLQEPHLKMSKSHLDPLSSIILTDSPDEITCKIRSALTDSVNSVSYDPISRPGVSNLLHLLSYFSDTQRSPEELGQIYAGLTLGIRLRYSQVLAEDDDGHYLDHIEAKGAQRARVSAEATMAVVRDAVGF